MSYEKLEKRVPVYPWILTLLHITAVRELDYIFFITGIWYHRQTKQINHDAHVFQSQTHSKHRKPRQMLDPPRY